jgi:hypothetical protein
VSKLSRWRSLIGHVDLSHPLHRAALLFLAVLPLIATGIALKEPMPPSLTARVITDSTTVSDLADVPRDTAIVHRGIEGFTAFIITRKTSDVYIRVRYLGGDEFFGKVRVYHHPYHRLTFRDSRRIGRVQVVVAPELRPYLVPREQIFRSPSDPRDRRATND